MIVLAVSGNTGYLDKPEFVRDYTGKLSYAFWSYHVIPKGSRKPLLSRTLTNFRFSKPNAKPQASDSLTPGNGAGS